MEDIYQNLQVAFAKGAMDAGKNFQKAENTTMEGGVRYQARRLKMNDLNAYLRAGNRKNSNKVKALENGQSIILTTEDEISDFINRAIDSNAGNTTVAYGQVNNRLAKEVYAESKGKININDFYLELIPTDLQHAYEQHSKAKEEGDIDLSREDFERIPEYLDSFTEVLYVIKYKSGNTKICVSKRISNGRVLIIETVSKSRGSVQFKNAIGVSEEKYTREYLNIYKKRAGKNTGESNSSNNTPRFISDSNDSISNPEEKVKRISSTDSDGNQLSAGQQSHFSKSKERDADGNLQVMYRGDSEEVTVYDRKKSKPSNLYGRGFYYTNAKSHAGQYGIVRAFYLNTVDPLMPGQHKITKDQMLRFLEAIENDGEDYDLYNYGEGATAKSVLEKVWGKGDFEMLQDVSASAIGDLVVAVELFNEINGTTYDSIRLPTETVIFNSNQAKLTTNKNPTDNPDIRYSVGRKTDQAVQEMLEKENADLREDVAKLKELVKLQGQETGGTKFTASSVLAAARYIKKLSNSKANTNEHSTMLNDFYEYIFTSKVEYVNKKRASTFLWRLVFALPIFPGRPSMSCRPQVSGGHLQASVVSLEAIRKASTFLWRLCVRVTYLPGQSPAKYCRRT